MTGEVFRVDRARLRHGQWRLDIGTRVGEGDICQSYSADLIALKSRIRKPFEFRGQIWVCVGLVGRKDDLVAKAYRLTSRSVFDGDVTTYAEITERSELARSRPQGFYHGMVVLRGSETWILTGPPVLFKPAAEVQLELFAA